MSAVNITVGIRRALCFVLLVTAPHFSGCGRISQALEQEKLEKSLEVTTTLNIFGGLVFIRNVGDEPITVRRVTINGKYVAENWATQMGGRGEKYEPQPLETGRQVILWLSGEWPRPEKITVETDQGTLTASLTYN